MPVPTVLPREGRGGHPPAQTSHPVGGPAPEKREARWLGEGSPPASFSLKPAMGEAVSARPERVAQGVGVGAGGAPSGIVCVPWMTAFGGSSVAMPRIFAPAARAPSSATTSLP